MTRHTDDLEPAKRIVLTFDICSSTAILEDLLGTENIGAWRDFLIWMKQLLITESREYNFEIYKFTGDGWVLLYPEDCSGGQLFECIEHFSDKVRQKLATTILPLLNVHPHVTGLTFGLDRGTLVSVVMMGRTEYVGRALNMAARLQSAIKDRDKQPQYKVMLTKHLYRMFRADLQSYRCDSVERTLRNVAGEQPVHCVKVWLKCRPQAAPKKR